MTSKILLKAGLIAIPVVGTTLLIAWLVKRVQYLREDVNYQIVERIHERLANAKKQLFQEYERQTTRENIHKAIVHVDGWEYFCDSDGMETKLMVSIDLLNALIIDDPEGKIAYLECRDILKECIDLIEDMEPKKYYIDYLADDIKRFIKKRKGRDLLKNISVGFQERLDPEAYELSDTTTEMSLRPIYPWDSDYYPVSFCRRMVDEFVGEGNDEG